MANARFSLDTNALICLAGLEDSDLQDFKIRIEATNSELCITHIQMDEWKLQKEERNYQRKIEEALASLKNREIVIHDIEPTKGFIVGVSRIGYSVLGGEEVGRLYDELREEIEDCEGAKGRIRSVLNIARDAVIAVSSLDHDFLITCDKCLYYSWNKIIDKYRKHMQKFKFPKVVYTRRNSKDVAERILENISIN